MASRSFWARGPSAWGVRMLSVASCTVVLLAWLACSKKRSQVERIPKSVQGASKESTPLAGPAPSVSQRTASTSSVPACPRFTEGQKLGRATNQALVEASGLVSSRRSPSVLWTHNDSGNRPQLFALTTDGRDLGTYQLAKTGIENWEDLAIGPTENQEDWYIYVGDIGDNGKRRKTITVFRIVEPEVALDQKPKNRKVKDVDLLHFAYPDGGVHDAETLMVDSRTGDLYVVTKPRASAPTVYRAAAPQLPDATRVMEEVGKLPVFEQGKRRSTLVTAGDISVDGSQILIRGYETAFLWHRLEQESVAEALRRAPCEVPLADEKQGEAIAFSPDGAAYMTITEGQRPRIFRFDSSL